MDAELFDLAIGDLAATLGDATRRGIYVSVREATDPMTAVQIASAFGIHPNVARHHLDRLAEDGYLQITRRRRSGKSGPGAGRPAKCYEATDKEITIQFPPRRHDLLARMLIEVVHRVAPDEGPAIAEEVGREYGRRLAGELGLDEAGDEVGPTLAAAMVGIGFETSAGDDSRLLLTSHCPFGSLAAEYPEIVCKMDQGIVRGLLETADRDGDPVVLPHRRPGDACITRL